MPLATWWLWLANAAVIAIGILVIALLERWKRKKIAEIRRQGGSDAIVLALRELEYRLMATNWQTCATLLIAMMTLILSSTFVLLNAILGLY